MFSDLVDGARGVAFVGRVLSGSSCVSWIPSDPLVELYHWLQGGGGRRASDPQVAVGVCASSTCRPPAALVSYCGCAIGPIYRRTAEAEMIQLKASVAAAACAKPLPLPHLSPRACWDGFPPTSVLKHRFRLHGFKVRRSLFALDRRWAN